MCYPLAIRGFCSYQFKGFFGYTHLGIELLPERRFLLKNSFIGSYKDVGTVGYVECQMRNASMLSGIWMMHRRKMSWCRGSKWL